jgi:C_GCAxxG_C_C family probable redox protein
VIILNKGLLAQKIHDRGFNCSQSVFCAFLEETGLDEKTAFQLSSGFGGGLRHGDACGAVCGAVMVLGNKYGKYLDDDLESKEKTYQMVEEFHRRFLEKNKYLCCRELLGCDITTEEGHQYAEDNELFEKVCANLIKSAAEIVKEMI